jgi:antirestriction protein ArdC
MTRTEGYCATLVHELIGWLGPIIGSTVRWAIASATAPTLRKIGAAFLCTELGITQDVRLDQAQYLADWLQLVKDDK